MACRLITGGDCILSERFKIGDALILDSDNWYICNSEERVSRRDVLLVVGIVSHGKDCRSYSVYSVLFRNEVMRIQLPSSSQHPEWREWSFVENL